MKSQRQARSKSRDDYQNRSAPQKRVASETTISQRISSEPPSSHPNVYRSVEVASPQLCIQKYITEHVSPAKKFASKTKSQRMSFQPTTLRAKPYRNASLSSPHLCIQNYIATQEFPAHNCAYKIMRRSFPPTTLHPKLYPKA